MHYLYSHLNNFNLIHRESLRENIFSVPEKNLDSFLSEYIQMAKSAPIAAPLAGATDIYPDSQTNLISTDTIRRLSLCANRIYVHDGLLELSLDWFEIDGIHRMAQNHNREERIEDFREQLCKSIDFLLEIEPLVTCGVIHLLSTAGNQNRPNPNRIYARDLFGPDGPISESENSHQHPLMSNEVRNFLESHTKLKAPVLPGQENLHWQSLLNPPNLISILIGDEEVKEFRFFSIKTVNDSAESMRLQMYHLDDRFAQPITPDMFRTWVQRSAEEVMVERVEKIHDDIVLAQQARARFLTNSPISRGLLNANLQNDQQILGILGMDLPFFDNVSIKDIAAARRNELAFEEFRQALDKALRQIPSESEPSIFQKSLDELSRDLLRIPLLKIEQENARLKQSVFRQAILGIGNLGLYCINPALVIPGALYTAANIFAGMYDTSKPSQEKIRDMPGYYYWEISRKPK